MITDSPNQYIQWMPSIVDTIQIFQTKIQNGTYITIGFQFLFNFTQISSPLTPEI